MEKVQFFFEFYFGLKYQKMTLTEGGASCECPCLQVNAPFYILKVSFYSWNCPFIFQNCPFVSRNSPVVFQKCPFLQNCPLVFHKYLLFIYCARLFQEYFFSADFSFSSSCSQLLRQIIFALLLFRFSWNYLLTNL